ncbi:MAG: CaiB/BaiF CoA-transferase family protein [Pseudomonadota bacterium]
MKLEGIRVIELSLFLPGPLMTQMMADHGADVIKVEPAAGEPAREIGVKRDDVTVWFANTHRGKRSVRLNLKDPDGREALMRLAASADVLVEAFRPGVVDRLGVGYDALKGRAPQLIYASISAFGQYGPYVKRPAHDLATEALAGILSVNRGPDDQPAMPGIANADMLASMMCLSAVLMALVRRNRTGRGDYVDIAMMDSLLAAMPNNVGPVFGENRAPIPKDERSWGGNAMYNIYATKDGRHLVIGASELHFAENLLNKLERPDLLALCARPPGPEQAPVRDFLQQTFLTKTLAEWDTWFADVDCAFAPVNDLLEAINDPQFAARDMVLEDERGWKHIGLPFKFREEPGAAQFAWPKLGEHSETVLADLGFTDEQIGAMRDNGVI